MNKQSNLTWAVLLQIRINGPLTAEDLSKLVFTKPTAAQVASVHEEVCSLSEACCLTVERAGALWSVTITAIGRVVVNAELKRQERRRTGISLRDEISICMVTRANDLANVSHLWDDPA